MRTMNLKCCLLKITCTTTMLLYLASCACDNRKSTSASGPRQQPKQQKTALCLYVGLGQDANDNNKVTNKFWRYSLAKNTWTPIADYPKAGFLGIAFTHNDKPQVGAPIINLSLLERSPDFSEYDPIGGQWKTVTEKPKIPTQCHVFSFIVNNKSYIIIHDLINTPNFFISKYENNGFKSFPIQSEASNDLNTTIEDIKHVFVIKNQTYILYLTTTAGGAGSNQLLLGQLDAASITLKNKTPSR